MKVKGNTLYATKGKILRRISDKMVSGTEYSLGYTYYIGGTRLSEPKLEVPEDFEEVTQEELDKEKWDQYPGLVEKFIRERYSSSDEFAIIRQQNTKPDAFQEYFVYCEDCKQRAKSELGLLE